MSDPIKPITLNDVRFWYDAVSRSELDIAGRAGRNRQIQEVRQLLMELPEADFQAAVQAVRAIATTGRAPTSGAGQTPAVPGRALYDSTRSGEGPVTTAKTSAIRPVS